MDWYAIISVLGALLVVPFAAYYLVVRRLADPEESNRLTSVVVVGALSVALFSLALVPFDVYTVSANLDSASGQQSDPHAVKEAGDAIKTLYYVLYGACFVFAFVLMPFAFFYFEEDTDDVRTRDKTCHAFKATLASVVVFGMVLAIAVLLNRDHFTSDSKDDDDKKWTAKLSSSFSRGDSILSFAVASLATVGLVGWITYTAFGLALAPVRILQRIRDPVLRSSPAPSSTAAVDAQIRRVESSIRVVSAPYSLRNKKWSAKDLAEHKKLQKEKRRLELLRERMDSGERVSSLSCAERCFNNMAPVRVLVGVVLLGVSCVLVTSLVISTVDKWQHSKCKGSCGYALPKPEITNPVDVSLRYLAKHAFPVDYAVYGFMVFFLFLCTVSGLVSLGVRFGFFKLFNIYPRKTTAQALLMGVWLVMFTIVLLNIQLVTLAPQYTTYGSQFYLKATASGLQKEPCDTHSVFNGTQGCVMTQLSQFVHSTQLSMPFFGVIFFYSNMLFVAAFALSMCCAWRRSPRPEDSDYERINDSPRRR